jgi:hypothetical protein
MVLRPYFLFTKELRLIQSTFSSKQFMRFSGLIYRGNIRAYIIYEVVLEATNFLEQRQQSTISWLSVSLIFSCNICSRKERPIPVEKAVSLQAVIDAVKSLEGTQICPAYWSFVSQNQSSHTREILDKYF